MTVHAEMRTTGERLCLKTNHLRDKTSATLVFLALIYSRTLDWLDVIPAQYVNTYVYRAQARREARPCVVTRP